MKVEIHREKRPNPIKAVTLTLDVEQMKALLDVCSYNISSTRAIQEHGSIDYSHSQLAAETALSRLYVDIPAEVKRELRRQS